MDVNIFRICNNGLPLTLYSVFITLVAEVLLSQHISLSVPLAVITVREINWCCCRNNLSQIFIFSVAVPHLLSVFISFLHFIHYHWQYRFKFRQCGPWQFLELYFHVYSHINEGRVSMLSVTTHRSHLKSCLLLLLHNPFPQT